MAQGWTKEASAKAQSAKAVFERYATALTRYLLRRVRRPEDVEDMVQEIFELFVKRKNHAEEVRDPQAYLFRIAFHVVGATLSEQRRSPVAFDSRLQEEVDLRTGGSCAEEAEELAAQRDVAAALAKLPSNYLAVLMLVEGQGMSYKEAARVTGFKPSTVAAYVMHGRAALKLALDGLWKGKP